MALYGDMLYDWAKLYQSIIGYDKILQDKFINTEYENKIKEYFENYFINLYSVEQLKYLKIITRRLLFSLIPLHNNDKCYKYYDLIFTI